MRFTMQVMRLTFALLFLATGSCLICAGCFSVSPQQTKNTVLSASDEVIMKRVIDYSGADEDQEAETWNEIQKYPREELIRNLIRLSSGLPQGDDRQVSIAFVLCRLNHEYESNRQIILTALAKRPPFNAYMGDWAASLVDRLIERGDKKMLRNLFESTRVSDGAMTARLSGYFTKHFRNDTYGFLAQLAFEPPDIKENVFAGVRNDEVLTEAELQSIKDRLRAIASERETVVPTASEFLRNVDLRPIAEEMLQALSKEKKNL